MARKTATENTTPTEKVLQTIRHLLARQNHPAANENEAAVCAAKVQQLLLAHGLEMAQVDAGGDVAAPGVIEQTVAMGVGGRDSYSWTLDLATAVSYATFTRYLVRTGDRTLVFIGQETDVEVAAALYTFLSEQIARLMMQDVYRLPLPSAGGPDHNDEVSIHGFKVLVPFGWKPAKNRRTDLGTDTYTYCRNFVYGAARRVSERLHRQVSEMRQQHAQANKVTALVVQKDGLINSYVIQKYPKLGTVAAGKSANGAGLVEGFLAGEKVQLHNRTRLENGAGKVAG